MRSLFFLLFFGLIQLGFSQSSFEAGYLINNDGDSLLCWIKYLDKYVSPEEVAYRMEEVGETQVKKIEAVRAFGIPGKVRYVRANVPLEVSKSQESKLSSDRAPQFEEKWLFLEVLIEGAASLYRYAEPELERFFYRTADDSTIQPLIYKRFLKSGSKIGENNTFQQTLWAEVNCDNQKSQAELAKVDYKPKTLAAYFSAYNRCVGSEQIDYQAKRTKSKLSLNLRLGSSFAQTARKRGSSATFQQDGLMHQIGIELAWALPFRNNQLSLTLEPAFMRYVASSERLVYNQIWVNPGVRFIYPLNSKLRVVGNAGLGVRLKTLELNNTASSVYFLHTLERVHLGGGLEFYNRFQVEVRYFSSFLIPDDQLDRGQVHGIGLTAGVRVY